MIYYTADLHLEYAPIQYLSRLHGQIHLVRGSHDTPWEDAELIENNRKYYSGEYPTLFPIPPEPDRNATGIMPRRPAFKPLPVIQRKEQE